MPPNIAPLSGNRQRVELFRHRRSQRRSSSQRMSPNMGCWPSPTGANCWARLIWSASVRPPSPMPKSSAPSLMPAPMCWWKSPSPPPPKKPMNWWRWRAKTGRVLTVGHQERFVFARTGLLDLAETPLEINCWRRGPWTGRGDDVSAVLDLMIHDLDLVHTLVPGAVTAVKADGPCRIWPLADEVSATVAFTNGTVAQLDTSRIAETRKRGLRAVYADGVVEIDFLTRKVTNTTPASSARRWKWAIRWANRWPVSSPRHPRQRRRIGDCRTGRPGAGHRCSDRGGGGVRSCRRRCRWPSAAVACSASTPFSPTCSKQRS